MSILVVAMERCHDFVRRRMQRTNITPIAPLPNKTKEEDSGMGAVGPPRENTWLDRSLLSYSIQSRPENRTTPSIEPTELLAHA